jgi:hypothetical protein
MAVHQDLCPDGHPLINAPDQAGLHADPVMFYPTCDSDDMLVPSGEPARVI